MSLVNCPGILVTFDQAESCFVVAGQLHWCSEHFLITSSLPSVSWLHNHKLLLC